MSIVVRAAAVTVRRLAPWASGLNQQNVEAEVIDADRILRTQYSCLTTAELTEDDLGFLADAVGTLAAVRMLGTAALSSSEGLSRLKGPEHEYTFATPTAEDGKRLSAQVAEAVGLISCVRRKRSRRSSFSMFGAAGYRRALEREMGCGNGWLAELLPSGWM